MPVHGATFAHVVVAAEMAHHITAVARSSPRSAEPRHHTRQVAPEQRIAAVLRFARFAGPTGDIDQLLGEIERGRALA